MSDWRTMFEWQCLKALHLYDGEGRACELTLTIKSVVEGKLKGDGGREDKMPIIVFHGDRFAALPFGANKTNCRTIASLYGNNTRKWAGKRVTLFVQPNVPKVGSRGETVDAIRIRPIIPPEPQGRPPGQEG